MTNLIEDIGFTNPESKPEWNNAVRDNDGIYFGQLDPYWKKNLDDALDDQEKRIVDIEDKSRRINLPKQALIFGGGLLVVLTVLIIIKYK